MDLFSIATLWIKKRKIIIDKKYFSMVETWLHKYINSWEPVTNSLLLPDFRLRGKEGNEKSRTCKETH
jgi:hypothetical protein